LTIAGTLDLYGTAVSMLAPGCIALAALLAVRQWHAGRRRRVRGDWRLVESLAPYAKLRNGGGG
jgi:hypothetical protein